MKNAIAPQKTKTKFATKHFRIGLISSFDASENAEWVFRGFEAMCELGFVVSVLATGTEENQKKCMDIADKYVGQFEILESTPQNKKKIMSQSDVVLFLETPEKADLKDVMSKGIVPITPECEWLENFDAQAESGNGFCFSSGNFWAFFATVVRAFENYKFSYDWNNLRKSVKKTF